MADTKQVKLDKIRTDGETQSRVEIDTNVVADYQADIEAGTTLPPADVYHDGAATWLADGFHRYFAYKRAGKDEMPCIIHEGTQKDAQWHSVGSNKGHGLRRSNADKQNAVRMALDLHDERSDSAIATHVGVDHKTVAKYRAELTREVPKSATREGKDGRKIKTGKIGNATRDELISGLTKRAKVPAKAASLPEVRKLAELEEEDQDAVADAMRKHEADTVTEAISMLRSQPPVDPFQEANEELTEPEAPEKPAKPIKAKTGRDAELFRAKQCLNQWKETIRHMMSDSVSIDGFRGTFPGPLGDTTIEAAKRLYEALDKWQRGIR